MKNKTTNLNKLAVFFAVVVIMKLLSSCSETTSSQPATAKGFAVIEEALKTKFGANAYYTDFTITYNKSIGNIVGVTVTKAPETLKMGQWNLTQDTWQQNSDITIEVPEGTQAKDYMFQLGDAISLSKLGTLIEQSVKILKDKKSLNNPTLSVAGLNFPDNGDVSKAQYMINLMPQNGGTTFRFYYTLAGSLIDMNY